MTNERLPIGGCISELNCLQVRSSANVECVRDSQQHLREYGQLIAAHAAQSLELQRARDLGTESFRLAVLHQDRADKEAAELQAVREASSQSPPYDAGIDAQNAWADRRAAARNNAAAALKQSRGAT
jgi:hypothetical protein